jgi:glycosyltransferase involved in cell wall biosynthesis
VRDRTLVTLVAPFYNERDSLPELIQRWSAVAAAHGDAYEFEFVLVDDGSRDDSLSVARGLVAQEPRLRVIELRRNYGQTAALQAALDAAEGDIIVSMDADLQHFPEEIPRFLAAIEAGSDVVCGWRHERQEGIIRRWPSRAANYLIRRIARVSVHDVGTTFRAYRREIVQDLRLLGEHHRFVPVLAQLVGARLTELPIQNVERPHGQSNYGVGRTLNVFIDLAFLFFFTRYLDRPIRIFGRIALGAGALGLAIAGWLVFVFVTTGRPVVRDHSGWFILSSFLMLTAVQVLLAGILAELLTRVYFAQSERSSYQVRRVWRHAEG